MPPPRPAPVLPDGFELGELPDGFDFGDPADEPEASATPEPIAPSTTVREGRTWREVPDEPLPSGEELEANSVDPSPHYVARASSRRRLVLPETTISPGRAEMAPGEGTLYVEAEKALPMRSPSGRTGYVPSARQEAARSSGFADLDSREAMRGQQVAPPPPPGPYSAERFQSWASGEDPEAYGPPGAGFEATPLPAIREAFSFATGAELPSTSSVSRFLSAPRRRVERPGEDRSIVGMYDAASEELSTLFPQAARDPREGLVERPTGDNPAGLNTAPTQLDLRDMGLLTGATEIPRQASGLISRATGFDQDAGDDRFLAETVEAQAPEMTELGRATSSMGVSAALPGGQSSALARLATSFGVGAGLGALRGGYESEADTWSGRAQDAAREGLQEGALSVGTQGTSELAAPALQRLSGLLLRGGDATQRAATQSRLEATGVWGDRAMRAADALPGGQQALAEDARRLGVGHGISEAGGGRRWIPRAEPAIDDAREVMSRSGGRMGEITSDLDQAAVASRAARQAQQGPRVQTRDARGRWRPYEPLPPAVAGAGEVDLRAAADEIEATAAQLDRIPVGGREAARVLRERLIEPLRSAEIMSFGDAHRQRQLLDQMVRSWEGAPELTTASGQLRTARNAISRQMDLAAERLDPATREAWRQANRDYQVGAYFEEYGRGAQRRSVQGGMGGAFAAGTDIATGLPGGGMLAAAAHREMAQQQRMLWPGVRAIGLEHLAPALRTLGGRGQQYAATLEQAARQGRTGPAVAHYLMSARDPEYRRAVEQLQQQEEE